MCDQDRFEHEVDSEPWYIEQDQDEAWIAEQIAIMEEHIKENFDGNS